jgi:hypothetical protein
VLAPTTPGPAPGSPAPSAEADLSSLSSFPSALLSQLEAIWPQLRELHLSSGGKVQAYRLQHAATSLAACARAEMTAALLAQRLRHSLMPLKDEMGLAVTVLCGAARHANLLFLRSLGGSAWAAAWHMSTSALAVITRALRSVIAPPAVFGAATLPPLVEVVDIGLAMDCALAVPLFGAALSAGWPWPLSLLLFTGLRTGRPCGAGHGFVPSSTIPPLGGAPCLSSTLASDLEPDIRMTVFFIDSAIVFLQCSRAVFGSPSSTRGPVPPWLTRNNSRWLPDYIRIPRDAFGIPILPKLGVSALVEKRHVWERLIKMDGITRSIVFGKLCYPRTSWCIVPSYLPNHPSWEYDRVKEKLGPKMAVYFFQGALEVVLPGQPLPTIIEPQGAVPKKGPDVFRAIADSRKGNKSIADWGSRSFTGRELASGLSPCAIVSGHDINDGYHISNLTGCTGELVPGLGIVSVRMIYPGDPDFDPPTVIGADGSFQPAYGPHGPQGQFVFGWRLHVGCWPATCSQTCDKSYNGLFFDGCVARWAVAHFGQKPAGSPLNCIALCLLRHGALRGPFRGERRGASGRSLTGVVWVDDFTFFRTVPPHPSCGGLVGSCPVCHSSLTLAERCDEWWIDLCDQLGVSLNLKKHQRCAQSVEYAGFRFDTLLGRMLVLPEKLVELVAALGHLASLVVIWTLRRLDSVKGRLLHYSAAIPHVRVFVSELACLMGPTPEEIYDRPLPPPPGLPALADELRSVLNRYGSAGVPLWPPVLSSAYAAMISGNVKDAFCSLTWDASTFGWAGLARWWDLSGSCPVLRDLLLLGTWPAGWDVSQQAYREALGGPLAFDAFLMAADVQGLFCILRNDAEAAMGALRKGSTQSAPMQRCALHLARTSAAVDVPYGCWHVPGLTLIAEGIDGASRAGTVLGPGANLVSILGPSVSDSLWAQIRQAASTAGWVITVDAFATESNTRADRFWSCHHEPGAEAIDALSILDWSSSLCPTCGSLHQEVLYAFPPLHLIRPTVDKACADRAKCVLIVPVSILACYWEKLLAASVLPLDHRGPDGFIRIRSPAPHLLHAHGFAPSELAIFGILGPAPAGRLPTLHLAVVTAPRPRSASFTDRPTPLAASRSRRRGCPSTGPPGPPARLGSLHPRASGSFRRAGYTGARAMRIRLVSVGPASSDHVPPLAARPPSSRLPLICGTSPPTRSAVR